MREVESLKDEEAALAVGESFQTIIAIEEREISAEKKEKVEKRAAVGMAPKKAIIIEELKKEMSSKNGGTTTNNVQ